MSQGVQETAPLDPEPQPAKGAAALKRRTNASLAELTGYSPHHISRVLNGHVEPSRRLRRALALALDEPESVLFRDQQIAS